MDPITAPKLCIDARAILAGGSWRGMGGQPATHGQGCGGAVYHGRRRGGLFVLGHAKIAERLGVVGTLVRIRLSLVEVTQVSGTMAGVGVFCWRKAKALPLST